MPRHAGRSGCRERTCQLGAGSVGSRCQGAKPGRLSSGRRTRSPGPLRQLRNRTSQQPGPVPRTPFRLKPLDDLQHSSRPTTKSTRSLARSERHLAELDQAWPVKRTAYERQFVLEDEEIVEAQTYFG